MKKIWIWILCAVLVMSNVLSFPAFAEETDSVTEEETVQEDSGDGDSGEPDEEITDDTDEEGNDESGEENDDESGEEGSEPEGIRKISASTDNISFGTITEGDQVEPEEFSIENTGNLPAYISWSQADSESAFELTALDDGEELAPGSSMAFQVSLNDLSAGDYTATILFSDGDDPPAEAEVSLSVKVKAAEAEGDKEEAADPEENTEGGSEGNAEASGDSGEGTEGSKEAEEPAEPSDDKTYEVSTVCEPEEGGYTCGEGIYGEGSSVYLLAFENDGYVMDGWYLKGEKVSDELDLTVDSLQSDLTYTAKFNRVSYQIKVSTKNTKYGKVSGGGSFNKGEETVIKAQPEAGYRFAGWYEGSTLISDEKDYTLSDIDSSHSFTAVFKPQQHTVKISAYPRKAGTVSGSGKYDHGANAKLSAEPNDGYVFKGFSINNNIVSENFSYNLKGITKDVSVTAYFVKDTEEMYEITAGIANKGGSISPSGKIAVERGGSINYTFAPDNGYVVQEVSVDGEKIGARQTYTFKNIREDHKISVAFAPKKGNEKNVKKDKIITEAEAEKIAVATLKPAQAESEDRYSNVVTPEMYARMKEEGTLAEALALPEQTIVGMDNAENLPEEVNSYNYDEAVGLYQIMDITPDQAKKMIAEGNDSRIIREAYKAGYLSILINNQFLTPGKEHESTDMIDDLENDSTVKNMLEFMSGVLSEEDKLYVMSGRQMAVNLGITKGSDFTAQEKKLMSEAGAEIKEYFHMIVMKQRKGEKAQLVTELNKPVEVTLEAPKGSASDCIIRLHDGQADILPDIDHDPDTITIRTDKFSPYAFGKQKQTAETGNGLPASLPIGLFAAVLLVVAVISAIIIRKRRTT